MNLSTDTLSVLKNFSDINQNLLIKPGNKVQTISTMKNILAEAEVSEKFESEFAIYDLPEFLRSVELFDKPELKFNGGGYVNISKGNSRGIKYFFADKSVIVSPSKGINMPDKHVTFTLKKDDFTDLMKGATTLIYLTFQLWVKVVISQSLLLTKRISLQIHILLLLVKLIKSLQLSLELKTLNKS